MALVTLELALGYLRQDAGIEDDVISLLLDGAESSVLTYLNRSVYETQDDLDSALADESAGAYPIVVNGAIKVAILKTLGELYVNREDSVDGRVGELPFNIKSLLGPLRIIPGF